MRHVSRLLLLVVGPSLLSAGPAAASMGVSIDVGSIAIREELSPGGQYKLPMFGVRNPGTEQTSYVIVVSYVDGQAGLRPPATWFTFDPSTLAIAGGDSRPVNTSLEIPPDAEPGDYAALIGPQIVGEGRGAQVGAGAAVRLTFTLKPATAFDAWLRWFGRFFSANPWVWIGGLLIVLLVLIGIMRRRFIISVTRRP